MQTLFGTSLDAVELYDKPMARNCQLWSEDATLLLDGPNSSRRDIERAAETLLQGRDLSLPCACPGDASGCA